MTGLNINKIFTTELFNWGGAVLPHWGRGDAYCVFIRLALFPTCHNETNSCPTEDASKQKRISF